MFRVFRSRESVLVCLMVVSSLLAPLLLCEAAYRVKNALVIRELGEVIVPDAALGWRARENYRFSGDKKDFVGETHRVEIVTDAHGFRQYASGQGKCRVFCVGDSFTFAKDVSQSEPYYAVAGEVGKADMYAYGTDGFDSLQEFLVLDQWMDTVKPDVVVWQFCLNDFVNNHVALTRLSAKNQCQVSQPYLSSEGAIHYANPGEGALGRLLRYVPSAFLRAMAHRIDNRGGLPKLENTIEARIEKGDPEALRLFGEAVAITDKIMGKVRSRCGTTPILCFDVVCRFSGNWTIPEFPKRLQSVVGARSTVRF